MEDRIEAMEAILSARGVTVNGTQVCRSMADNGDLQWIIGFGMMGMPKRFFNGDTISDAMDKAETWALALDREG